MDALRRVIGSPEPLPRSSRPWGGADVAISFCARPGDRESSFYPAPRMVYTAYALELSWLFESLRDSFALEPLLDGCNKMYGEMKNHTFRSLPVAFNGEIADDLKKKS